MLARDQRSCAKRSIAKDYMSISDFLSNRSWVSSNEAAGACMNPCPLNPAAHQKPSTSAIGPRIAWWSGVDS